MQRFLLMLLTLLAALLLAAGCGSDESTSDDGGSSDSAAQSDDAGGDATETTDAAAEGTVIELGVVKNKLEFDTTTLDAEAGTITLRLVNEDAIPHNIAVKDGDETLEEGELVSNGDVSEITLDVEAGKTYTYFCTPHEGAGMTGELTVA